MKNYFLTIASIMFLTFSCNAKVSNYEKSKSQKESQQHLKSIVVTNVNLIPMYTDTIIPHQTVIIKDGIISKIKSFEKNEVFPSNVVHIDGTKLFLLPGIADMHTHPSEYYEPVPPLHLFLANGVTTIRSCDGLTGNFILRWRDQVNSHERIGPQIFAGGPFLHRYSNVMDSIIKLQHSFGFDFIKTSSFMTAESFSTAMKTAHEIGMYSMGHIPFSVGIDGVLKEGIDEISHVEELVFSAMYDYDYENELIPIHPSKWYTKILKKMSDDMLLNDDNTETIIELKKELMKQIALKLKKHNTTVNTTLYVDHVLFLKSHDPESLIKQAEFKYVPESYKKELLAGKDRNQNQVSSLDHLGLLKFKLDSAQFRELYDQNVFLVFGTDAFPGMGIVPGYSIHGEFEMLSRYGLSPYEALKLATVNASKVASKITGRDDFGTIEKGKRADLILLKANPLETTKNLKLIEGVIASGTWLSADTLSKLIEIEDDLIPQAGRTIMFDLIKMQGINAGLKKFWESKNAVGKANRLLLDEKTLTYLGYDLLKEGLKKEAIEIFKLCVAEYPFSSNTYDSLAEAYAKNGDKELARQYYLKVLALRPDKKEAVMKTMKNFGL